MFSFFINLKDKYTEEEIYNMFELYEISKLDINRIYRYLDKYLNKNYKSMKDDNTNDVEDIEPELNHELNHGLNDDSML